MKVWKRTSDRGDVASIASRACRFQRLLPAYAPTPLRSCPAIAARLGVRHVFVKDESDRLGLPAYKALGGAWAVCRLCSDALGRDLARCETWQEVLDAVVPLRPRRLVTATDGNHGRGVAHVARLFGFDCAVHVPGHTVAARIDAIRSEGAEVVVHAGNYDEAVQAAVADAEGDTRAWLVQDTVLGKHADTARWCAEGYVTIFEEIEEELLGSGLDAPDVFVLQIGVGTIADAMIRCVRSNARWAQTRLVGAEPINAACALTSLTAGEMRPAAGTGETIMAGLNCPTVSPLAWPTLRDGLDACIAIEDSWAEEAMCLLAAEAVEAGESGAAGLAALLAARESKSLEIPADATVLLLNTEGATDPAAYTRIVNGP